jgi:hypothetical protein
MACKFKQPNNNEQKILLGSGERKEFVIAAQRIGQTIIAVDSYENVWHNASTYFEVNNMDGAELDRIIAKHKPDFIVPRKIRTERFTITKTRNYRSSICESGKFYHEPKSNSRFSSQRTRIKTAITDTQPQQPNCKRSRRS